MKKYKKLVLVAIVIGLLLIGCESESGEAGKFTELMLVSVNDLNVGGLLLTIIVGSLIAGIFN